MIASTNTGCSVDITTSRNRVKKYNGLVYLKDGQRFELEIFNPHPFKVLAKIKMNGNYISSSGLVLKPGQRIYLERYIDTQETFVFSTYEVENSLAAKAAIAKNGEIEVEFYSEFVPSGSYLTTNADWTYRPGQITYQSDYWIPSTQPIGSTTSNTFGNTAQLLFDSNSAVYGSQINEVKGSLETGRVEKGEPSSQEFNTESGQYNSWAFEKVVTRILPLSAKPIESINREVRSYCTECGTRIKKSSWKFCPSCGEKL